MRRAVLEDEALRRGVNVRLGKITHEAVAEAFRLPHVAVEDTL